MATRVGEHGVEFGHGGGGGGFGDVGCHEIEGGCAVLVGRMKVGCYVKSQQGVRVRGSYFELLGKINEHSVSVEVQYIHSCNIGITPQISGYLKQTKMSAERFKYMIYHLAYVDVFNLSSTISTKIVNK